MREVETVAREAIESSEILSSVNASHRNHYVREVRRVGAGYCDLVQKYLSKQIGWKKAKVFVDHRAHMKHVFWAVMFQLEGKSYSEIANEMPAAIGKTPAVSTVKRGVSEILDIIRLDTDRRRQVKRGPKPGSVQSDPAKMTRDVLQSLGR